MHKSICKLEIDSSLRNNFLRHKEKFLNNINIPFDATNNECWEWSGKLNESGYGLLFMSFTAHRFSYILYKGKQPYGTSVLHTCDNRKCINPHHLFLGNNGVNNKDRNNKGRSIHNGKAFVPLTDNQLLEIRSMYKNGNTQEMIAKKFNINQSTVSYIIRKKGYYAS